ncbi:hypothetical protein GOV14_07135 [Candidatus Pacearchaeota archaeon]|nr:hypothetical protein [Candidatus Pacearchaeota archaeon]
MEDERAVNAQKEIKKFLKKTSAELKIVNFDSDIYELVKKVHEIISKEKKNIIYLCITPGQRDSLSVFIISSMLFHNEVKEICLYSLKGGEFTTLPHFQMKLPKSEIIEAIKFIALNEEGCTKKKLRDHLFEKKILKISKKTKFPEHSQYVKLNRAVLDPAEHEWHLIKIEGKKRGSKVTLTEEGEKWSKIF